jgi:hypothetical protein
VIYSGQCQQERSDKLQKVEMRKTMSSPSPTQSPPALIPEKKLVPISQEKQALTVEHKPPRSTPVKKRIGDTRTARVIKNIFRPPIKALYYVSNWIKKYKLASLGILLLLIVSATVTTYRVTGELPLGINQDPYYSGGKGEGNVVKDWLDALRNGYTTQLSLLDGNIPSGQAPDPAQLVSQFSHTQAHLNWGQESVIAVKQQSDSTVDSFVQVPIVTSGPDSPVKAVILWHFVTVTSGGQSTLLGVDLISMRPIQS